MNEISWDSARYEILSQIYISRVVDDHSQAHGGYLCFILEIWFFYNT